MSYTEITMYRIVCDHPECDRSTSDSTEYYAWADTESVLDIAQDSEWWLDDDLHLCHEHRPHCVDCDIPLYGPDPTTCEDCDTTYDRADGTYVKPIEAGVQR